MPKSGKNARPDNRNQKRASKRDREVLSRGFGKSTFSGTGPGREHNSAGVAAQATRELANYIDKRTAKKIKPKRGRKAIGAEALRKSRKK